MQSRPVSRLLIGTAVSLSLSLTACQAPATPPTMGGPSPAVSQPGNGATPQVPQGGAVVAPMKSYTLSGRLTPPAASAYGIPGAPAFQVQFIGTVLGWLGLGVIFGWMWAGKGICLGLQKLDEALKLVPPRQCYTTLDADGEPKLIWKRIDVKPGADGSWSAEIQDPATPVFVMAYGENGKNELLKFSSGAEATQWINGQNGATYNLGLIKNEPGKPVLAEHNPLAAIDTDNDGQSDAVDTDDDNDKAADAEDKGIFSYDAQETEDIDGDFFGDNADEDDDNDGTLDEADADDDNDGTLDTADTEDNEVVADADDDGFTDEIDDLVDDEEDEESEAEDEE